MTDEVSIPVRVVFRRWRDGGGVIALFPELPADIHGRYCDSYEHVGQHGGADYHGVVRHTAPATRGVRRPRRRASPDRLPARPHPAGLAPPPRPAA